MSGGYYRFRGGSRLGTIALALLAAAVTGGAVVTGYAELLERGLVGERARPGLWIAIAPLMALVAAAASARVLRWRKVRSRTAVTSTVVLAATAAFAAGWLARLWTWRPQGAAGPEAMDPAAVGHLAGEIAGSQVSLGPVEIAGASLLALCVLESLLIIALARSLARAAHRTPLCPRCRSWCTLRPGVARLAVESVNAVRPHLERRNWPYFRRLATKPARRGRHLRFDLATCPGCKDTNTLSVRLVRRPWRARTVADHLLLGPDCTRTVLTMNDEAGRQHRGGASARASGARSAG